MSGRGNNRFQHGNKSKDKRPRQKDFQGEKGKKKRKNLLLTTNQLEQIDEEIASLKRRYEELTPANIKKFSDFPLSQRTLTGLTKSKYTVPTDIQRESIGLALKGHDVLAAAKTGSGKTLAFLIPILECLYRQKWSSIDGLGALVIAPTRELAYQTFAVLRRIGKQHDFSAGLVVGGMNIKEESKKINYTNIIICTPGRFLQHMDETQNFTATNLQILVLDEADRILDLGFSETMNAIIENLPLSRQTLLFSATQTRSVKDLARLSLNNENLFYVSVDEFAEHSTPMQLQQSYIICELEEKMTVLWSFLKNHLKKKIVVFLTTCSQVRYIFKALCHMRPGISLHALYGKMKQHKRMEVFQQFCFKQSAVLFATDIAARGLDIPEVNWVIQLDCPEDANTYIHRVGRTARYKKNGESLLFLLPSEEPGMLTELQKKKIPIKQIQVNPKMLWDIRPHLKSQCAADITMKENAKKSFVTYTRAVFLMSNKNIFDVQKLNLEEFAGSLGLEITPRVRFLEREQERLANKKVSKTRETKVVPPDASSDSDDSSIDEEVLKKLLKLKKKHDNAGSEESDDDDDDTNELFEKLEKLRARVKAKSKKNEPCSSESEENDGDTEEESEGKCEKVDDSCSDEETEEEDSEEEKKEEKNSSKITLMEDFDGEDLLTLKRIIPAEPFEEGESEQKEKSKKSSKALTKIALAKRALKKKVQMNTKVKFDEEGEEIQDVYRDSQTVKKTTDDSRVGGIIIEEAKKFMETEDRFDKKLYQDKIKTQHKEKRLKVKEKKRLERQGEEAAATATLDSSKDKVKDEDEENINNNNNSDEDNDDEGSQSFDSADYDDDGGHDDDDSSDDSQPPSKRKRLNKASQEDSFSDNDDEESAEMSLQVDEELVLKMLQASKK